MDLAFTDISLADKEKYYQLWHDTPRRSLDYTLANLWGWQEYYGLQWSLQANIGWIRQTVPTLAYWAPIGNWNGQDWKDMLPRVMAGARLEFIRVPQELADLWAEEMAGRIERHEARGQWEYLYRQEELANLPGNRFHKKKNHYNSYVKTYGQPDYREIDTANVADVLAMQDVWCHWHECDDSPSLLAENEAIQRVLTHWLEFRNMTGGALYIEDKMVAFSVGEKLDEQTLGVHFEKALGGYKGIYQAMNCEFARHAGQGFEWINRAQDLDEEGLRQAKMTYLPAAFLKKEKVVITLHQ